MRKAKVLFKNEVAGVLIQNDDGTFIFQYQDDWIKDITTKSISPTLPKAEKTFFSSYLFPFFYNMLPEGSNKQIVCKLNRIDHDDHFGILMVSAKYDSVGAVTIVKIENE
jgi:serine/threonine-protein kinase HipA